MRRIWAAVFILVATALEACGGSGAPPAAPAPTRISDPSPPPSSPSPTPRTSVSPRTTASPSGAPSGSPSPAPTATPTPVPSPTPTPTTTPGSLNAIKHIVVIIQENRSFNNLFMGFPGANTASSGKMSTGQQVQLQPIPLEFAGDLLHTHLNFEREYANGNLYFDLGDSRDPTLPYAYVPQSETQPYWSLASQYVLADDMFQSNNGPSYVAHQYLIAGQSVVNQPGVGVVYPDENPDLSHTGQPNFGAWGCDDPPGTIEYVLGSATQDQDTNLFPCYDYTTLADELDAAQISWRYYAPAINGNFGAVWSAYDAINHIRYGPDWQNVVSPESRILQDASGPLPAVTYVVPDAANSDHSGTRSNTGPSWVADVVNAIGNGPNWNSTAIFIIWDDWGGWFDNAPPAQIDNMGLGFRVPLIVVSPYAKKGIVSHDPHELGSILHFIEERYGLPAMAASDRRADDLLDSFDFTQHARAFSAIRTRLPALYFLHQPPSRTPPDND